MPARAGWRIPLAACPDTHEQPSAETAGARHATGPAIRTLTHEPKGTPAIMSVPQRGTAVPPSRRMSIRGRLGPVGESPHCHRAWAPVTHANTPTVPRGGARHGRPRLPVQTRAQMEVAQPLPTAMPIPKAKPPITATRKLHGRPGQLEPPHHASEPIDQGRLEGKSHDSSIRQEPRPARQYHREGRVHAAIAAAEHDPEQRFDNKSGRRYHRICSKPSHTVFSSAPLPRPE